MKVLLISDTEEKFLWENWTKATADMLADVESAGDLNHLYLEFIVTMLNVPLVYVRGNHDGSYDEEPPEGCEDADGKVVEVECGTGSSRQKIRILGLGGSMRYRNDAADMYTENFESQYGRGKDSCYGIYYAEPFNDGLMKTIKEFIARNSKAYNEYKNMVKTCFEFLDKREAMNIRLKAKDSDF
mgnify:CR=1 FL=1